MSARGRAINLACWNDTDPEKIWGEDFKDVLYETY